MSDDALRFIDIGVYLITAAAQATIDARHRESLAGSRILALTMALMVCVIWAST